MMSLREQVGVIVDACARVCGVSADEVHGDDRHGRCVLARHMAWLLARDICGAYWHDIGEALGRNRSTLITAETRMRAHIRSGKRRWYGGFGAVNEREFYERCWLRACEALYRADPEWRGPVALGMVWRQSEEAA